MRSIDTRIMGVLNVTPDSFSDGGLYAHEDEAIAHGMQMAAQGADIIDVGGESTRPGAARVPLPEERARVIPVVRALAGQGIRVSVDTMNASTARAAVEAGAAIINDVSGGLADPLMAEVARETDVPYVVMHWRGHSKYMNDLAHYVDVATDVRDELFARVDQLVARGVKSERLIVDPGLGFSKDGEHNWQVLAHLDLYEELGLPLLIGASRKRFVGKLLPPDASMEDRDLPTSIITALAARAGAWAVRVHDVAGSAVALKVVREWEGGRRASAATQPLEVIR